MQDSGNMVTKSNNKNVANTKAGQAAAVDIYGSDNFFMEYIKQEVLTEIKIWNYEQKFIPSSVSIEGTNDRPKPYANKQARRLTMAAQSRIEPDREDIKSFNERKKTKRKPGGVMSQAKPKDYNSVLYSLGTSILAALIYPSVRQKMVTMAARTFEDGLELAKQASYLVNGTRAGIDDILKEAGHRLSKSRP